MMWIRNKKIILSMIGELVLLIGLGYQNCGKSEIQSLIKNPSSKEKKIQCSWPDSTFYTIPQSNTCFQDLPTNQIQNA